MRKRLSVSERRTAAPFWLGDLGFRTFWCAMRISSKSLKRRSENFIHGRKLLETSALLVVTRKLVETSALLLGARTLLGAPGLTSSNNVRY